LIKLVVLEEVVHIDNTGCPSGTSRPVTSLGHQEGRRVFREGPRFFEPCPIFLNYVQHIFPGGPKIFLGGLRPLVTGLRTRS